MLTYEPGESFAHRLDPRSKLAFQVGFAIAVFAAPSPAWLVVTAGVGVGSVLSARLSILSALRAYWMVLVVIGLATLLGGLTLGAPWFRVAGALSTGRRLVRLVPLLLVSAAFVRTTPVRDTRAAIQHTVPGKFGQLLGIGVALTVRFLPVVRADVVRIRDAIRARGGTTRSVRDRARRIASLSLARSVRRADNLSVALRARCFAYNPTLPPLAFSWRDLPVLALAVGLSLSPLAPLLGLPV